nr:MAG TPA: hypothetical protein [Caudoviricetes sp.]
MTKITLEIDGRVFSMELPYNDANATELMKGFCSLMQGQTFLAVTVKDALYEAYQDYKEELLLGRDDI